VTEVAGAPARVLVVANRTAGSDELLAALRERAARGPASFLLVVPATPHGVAWEERDSGAGEAERHLARALDRFREAGLEAQGWVGDPDPVTAVEDALEAHDVDEVVVSTLPRGVSRWLGLDLPSRVRRASGRPVTHVTAPESVA
jgi:hypothetical protein